MTGRRMQWEIVDLAAPTMLLPEETTPTQAAVDTETRTTRTRETFMPTILAREYKSTRTRLILIRTRIGAGVSRKKENATKPVEQAFQACGKEVGEIGFSRCGTRVQLEEIVLALPQRLKPALS